MGNLCPFIAYSTEHKWGVAPSATWVLRMAWRFRMTKHQWLLNTCP